MNPPCGFWSSCQLIVPLTIFCHSLPAALARRERLLIFSEIEMTPATPISAVSDTCNRSCVARRAALPSQLECRPMSHRPRYMSLRPFGDLPATTSSSLPIQSYVTFHIGGCNHPRAQCWSERHAARLQWTVQPNPTESD